MGDWIWYIIMIPCCVVLSGIGVYAWNRKEPMWFWIGKAVDKKGISDIAAYNHANGIMWGIYSLVYWAAFFVGIRNSIAALILIAAGCIIGLPLLAYAYGRIYKKYKTC